MFVITLTGDDTAELNGNEISYAAYDFGDGEIEYCFYAEGDSTEIYAAPAYGEASIDQYFEYTMTDTTISINGNAMEYTVDEVAGTMVLGGELYTVITAE